MNKDTFIILAFLGVVASVSYYALKKPEQVLEKPHKQLPVQTVNYLQPGISISSSLYIKALLESVMSITEPEYGPYEINIIASYLALPRKRKEMIKGDNINLIWTTEDINTIKELIKVPFHTMKGVLGYRAMIIQADRQDEFSKITNLEELQLMKPGQVKFWSDTYIYKSNNFNVVTSRKMFSLFPMLESNRFDFLPLGISEINQEYLSIRQKYPSLAIETDLLIKYSLHMFLMVSPNEPILAERLLKGLLEIEKSGEFDRIFNEFIQPEMNKIQIQNRRIIELESP
ncbi:type 2 periplasmic-binding domain-containing protein [Paraglaciecola arctica]|uniref:Solute-binding protein family 3/N-terminal domain-containing protein n=1 Tax=Paraglaciecola arctica BSs20135 TaxID=493475 RepID=K6XAD3_9ALTE|nr:hypothetical protein [Paraglaciecola arctica]GAC17589.1 hypothetical protein GARC_0608 [Paraglaciecola arctica BSs20135]